MPLPDVLFIMEKAMNETTTFIPMSRIVVNIAVSISGAVSVVVNSRLANAVHPRDAAHLVELYGGLSA